MTKAFELIVFDWDGTLMDSEARIVNCMKNAIDQLGLPQRDEHELRNIIGLGLKEALSTLYPDGDDDIYNQLIHSYRQFFLYTDDTPSELFSGVVEMLTELSERGHYLAVATGKGRQGLDQAMAETGVQGFFHFTRCADETRSKPHPQMLEDIMEYLGVTADNSLMVGDTEYDLQMAHNAGVRSLAVSYGVHEVERLLACQPLGCVDSIAQMHSWLLQNSGLKQQIKNGTAS